MFYSPTVCTICSNIPTVERDLYEGLAVNGRIDNIRLYLKEIGINTRNYIDSAQVRDYWRALVNAALNSGFHKPWS